MSRGISFAEGFLESLRAMSVDSRIQLYGFINSDCGISPRFSIRNIFLYAVFLWFIYGVEFDFVL